MPPPSAPPAASGRGAFTDLVGGNEEVADGVAHRIEEPAAAMHVAPPLGDACPSDWCACTETPPIARRSAPSGRPGARYAPHRRSELDLRPLAALGAGDQQHGTVLGFCSLTAPGSGEGEVKTAVAGSACISAPPPRRPLRRSVAPSRKRSSVNGALIGCGSSCAIVWANTCADPGVALNPPVPQPQLTYKPGHRRSADDRRAIRRHVDDAAPVAQHAHAAEHREQLADRVQRVRRRCAARRAGCRTRYASVPAPITSSPLSDWLI